jgi:hypothetical protein
MKRSSRRELLATLAASGASVAWPSAGTAGPLASPPGAPGGAPTPRAAKLKLSCNLYSFNAPLRSGEMSIEQAIDFCAELGFDAVDPTGYYFPGYPEPPADAYLHAIARRAFRSGLDVSGTGVGNDFTLADPTKRAAEVAHARRWVEVAATLGAPCLRVFDGRAEGSGPDREAAYEEIERLAPFACTWQLKERLYRRGVEEKTDVRRFVAILRRTGYRGYVPIETLGEGDPRGKVRRFLAEAKEAIGGDA